MKAYRGFGAPKKDAINDLDCVFCSGWFPSFTALSEHVKSGECQRKTKRPTSTQVTDDNERETNAHHERERDDMPQLPRSTRPASTPRRAQATSGRIPGATREQSNDYNPFLKAANIGPLGSTGKLTLTGNVRVSDGVYGEQIIAEAKIGRVTYDWAIKLNSPNHRELEDTLGLNTARWKNKIVAVEIKENMGRDYIAVQRARSQGSPRGGKVKKTKRAKR